MSLFSGKQTKIERKYNFSLINLACFASILMILMILLEIPKRALCQGTKSISSSNNINNFGTAISAAALPLQATGGPQLSSQFIQMFNSLTPIQQQQFIRQVSPSNRRFLQQALALSFPQTSNSLFTEEILSNSQLGASSPFAGLSKGNIASSSQNAALFGAAGTKSTKNFSSNNLLLSPAQQAFIRAQQKAGNLQPISSFFSNSNTNPQLITSIQQQQPLNSNSQFSQFSRQLLSSQQQQQPNQLQLQLPQQQQGSTSEFQLTKNTIQQLQQPGNFQLQPGSSQQSSLNRGAQELAKQVAATQQTLLLQPASEQSFRRVQSFSSQPIIQLPSTSNLPTETGGNFLSSIQQFIQQQQPQPQIQPTNGFSRFQQTQFSNLAGQPAQVIFTGSANPFISSSSSSSNLAGTGAGNFGDVSGFSAALQQEKLDASNVDSLNLGFNSLDGQQQQQQLNGVNGLPATPGQLNRFSQFFQQQQIPQQLTANGNFGTSNFAQFEAADAQQKNVASLGQPDEFYGLAAASINNKWYIMKPIEAPNMFGLSRTGSATDALNAALSSSLSSATFPTTSTAAPQITRINKKRASSDREENSRKSEKQVRKQQQVEKEKEKVAAAGGRTTSGSSSSSPPSSSAADTNDEEEEEEENNSR